jgi:hypothetical protein
MFCLHFSSTSPKPNFVMQASREQRHAEQGPAAVKSKSAAETAKDWRKQALGQKLKQKPGQHKGEQQQTAGAKRWVLQTAMPSKSWHKGHIIGSVTCQALQWSSCS